MLMARPRMAAGRRAVKKSMRGMPAAEEMKAF